ncbi:uncharacterized protein BO95DRAFT_260731 [Aspergillus brunneoviolaceus CBS 621.78]|uniref:Uncharacterized protein n=1 Tax=Aspergillus brunneoviolaceus CBS 621.78 TaxID=1450534 RepID=A0ACD1FXB3_9EURO|nr:hypothetical protein BO95DRAFT_260731 [Aspergillus brunneoviolaceus CBS 621.78]RAH41602.1 hypothetical protein BO95DRAFT_260731 [Aspergillus brunneoviolaceus CBS 621.78]
MYCTLNGLRIYSPFRLVCNGPGLGSHCPSVHFNPIFEVPSRTLICSSLLVYMYMTLLMYRCRMMSSPRTGNHSHRC